MLQSLRLRLGGLPGITLVATLAGFLAVPYGSLAQEAAPTPAAAQAAGAADQAQQLSKDQLESLVAPICLYPDPLLA
ncbi:MAG TPA: hypothetical protein VKG23_20250, partial [Thermoanaerobaculia bacterium]|nr:hypothetical protein [Thermoanaerobaculia bacterium]